MPYRIVIWPLPLVVIWLSTVAAGWAGEQHIVLRDYLSQQWTRELLAYPFSAPEGACHVNSVTLTGPQGPVPVQLTEVEYWPGTQMVKTAKVAFIADLAPLATDTYTVTYDPSPRAAKEPATDLTVTPGEGQVEITTKQFGARLLLGEKTYPEPVAASEVPGPVVALRLADGTWFGGSAMYGPGKIAAYLARLTDQGPVLARVAVRYTYENGNTLDLTLQVAAGDNTIRAETSVKQHQPADGFRWIVSRGLPPLVFQVQDEVRRDRPEFMEPAGYNNLRWADIPLQDYVAPKGQPPDLVTNLSPWEDWFGTFTQTRIRLRLENTERELQIRSLDPGAWVEPLPIESIFDPEGAADPAAGLWVGWGQKLLPIRKDEAGEVYLQVNAAQGLRKWTVSECLSMPGVAALLQWHNYKPESTFPPETRPTVGYRLNEVKDYVLEWPGDEGKHPLLFISRAELESLWKQGDLDPETLDRLTKESTAKTPEEIYAQYMPQWNTPSALGAYLLSGGSAEVGQQVQLAARLRQALDYELWGMQFGWAGAPAPILYDGVIDSNLLTDAERPLLRARMAYYAYRLADPAVWSAERGYASGNQNMTVTWEISRGLTACAIPTHPMAKVWYDKAQRIMEQFLNRMVGPAGEWPEAMGGHGRTSIDMLLSFAVASTQSGLHDYANDPRTKRMIRWWAKMETPRDPRPRGMPGATPNRRYFPAMGRDCIGFPGGTCGVLARVLRKTDPALSAELQWAWEEEGSSYALAHLGGFAYVACDKRLPAKQPAWTSEVFPEAGAVLRHGLGTPDEHQVMLYSGDHFAAFYTSHTGSFPNIFAYGTPVAGAPAGSYEYQEGFLTCHVDLARPVGTLQERQAVYGYHGCPQDTNMWNWPGEDEQRARFGEHGGLANVSSFSTLPRQDYAAVDVGLYYPRRMALGWRQDVPEWPPMPGRGKPPVAWRRDVLFLKDDPAQPGNYLLIRDSVKGPQGPQPTMWQMWTVSEKIGTPDEVKNLDAFLADKPGHTILPARELKGDRFTAIGQLGVDVEYYIASPSDTPRHTLRWGTEYIVSTTNKLAEPEYQDLLHLQMPGDGAYFVAFYPRKRDWPAPVFSTLGDGHIIKVVGEFGTDYGFLSALEATATGEGATFRGTAGSVQDRKSGLALTLGAAGEVAYKKYRLQAEMPASLRVSAGGLVVETAAGHAAGQVTIAAAGRWKLAGGAKGVSLKQTGQGLMLELPTEVTRVSLIKG